MATITHLQTNYQQPETEKEVDENGIETVYTKPSYKTTDGRTYDSIEDAKEHQKIVNHVEKWYYDLSGMTMRGNGWEHVRPSQSDIKRLLIRVIHNYQNKK
jgi:hypothetical protein